MTVKRSLLELANHGYDLSFPLYRRTYSVWKSFADRKERQLLARSATPGAVALDIGANIGVYTVFLSRIVGAGGRVVAFEPDSRNFRRLQDTVARCGNVEAVQAAVGDKSGRDFLYLSDSLNIDHQSYDNGEGRSRVEVDMIALDDYLDHRPVNLMKIDVQGFEMGVLGGASRTLARSLDLLILIEVWPHGLRAAGASAGELIYVLSQFGFRLQAAGRHDGRSVEDMVASCVDADAYFNLVAIKQ